MKTILYFTASWCGPCKAIAPILDDISKDYDGKLIVAKINIDENQKIAARNVPSLVLVDENGTELNRMVGVQPDQAIINFYNG